MVFEAIANSITIILFGWIWWPVLEIKYNATESNGVYRELWDTIFVNKYMDAIGIYRNCAQLLMSTEVYGFLAKVYYAL